MVKVAIVGALGGDEGKGKAVDEMVQYAKQKNDGKRTIVIRFQGGANAGHTLYAKDAQGKLKEFINHSAPSGLVSNVDIAIGPDVAFNPIQFYKELKEAKESFAYTGNVLISDRVGILFEHHMIIDAYREEQRVRKIGTTKSGIGPFYEDNCRRTTRMTFKDYISDKFEEKLREIVDAKAQELDLADIEIESYYSAMIEEHEIIRKELSKYSQRLEYRLQEYVNNGDHIIIEGSQGTLLDINMGTIPDVTSSHLLVPHAFPSLGLKRKDFQIICVEKIYPTRVGGGELPTLDTGDFGEGTVTRGGEFGATTGRKRRVGYPDWVLAKRAAMLNDADFFYITRADVIQGTDIKVCNNYNINGVITPEVPLDISEAKAVYMDRTFNFRLWEGVDDVSKALDVHEKLEPLRMKYINGGFESLPKELQEFIDLHDEFVGCKTLGLSLGPATGETVLRSELLRD